MASIYFLGTRVLLEGISAADFFARPEDTSDEDMSGEDMSGEDLTKNLPFTTISELRLVLPISLSVSFIPKWEGAVRCFHVSQFSIPILKFLHYDECPECGDLWRHDGDCKRDGDCPFNTGLVGNPTKPELTCWIGFIQLCLGTKLNTSWHSLNKVQVVQKLHKMWVHLQRS